MMIFHNNHKYIKINKNNEELTKVLKDKDNLKQLIEQGSFQGEVVLDPFAGSGSTIVAAFESNRQGLGFEMDKKYFVDGLERIKNLKKD